MYLCGFLDMGYLDGLLVDWDGVFFLVNGIVEVSGL